MGHAGISFLAAEGSPEQYVVRLRRADEKRLDLVSYGAASPDGVDTLASQLLGAGVRLISEPGQLTTPGGGYGFRFFDVDGRMLEVSAEVAARTDRRIEEQESIPVRLSHVVLNSPDLARTRDWYEQHLGFRLPDTLTHPATGEAMHFMRINSWHHSMAIAKGPHTALHHISFELRGTDEYMRGTGRPLRAGVDALPPAGPAVPLDSVRLLPPVQPPSVRDFVTFEEHVEGVRRAVEGGVGGPGTGHEPVVKTAHPSAAPASGPGRGQLGGQDGAGGD